MSSAATRFCASFGNSLAAFSLLLPLALADSRYGTERVEARQRLKEKAEFGETEQFLTKAYKDKLKEWELLDKEDAKQAQKEAAQDSKKVGMDSFYLNLMHDNVSMGQMVDKVPDPITATSAGEAGVAAGSDSAAAPGGGKSGRGSSDRGGQDGDGVELGIAGGSQMVFEDIAAQAEEKHAIGKRRG